MRSTRATRAAWCTVPMLFAAACLAEPAETQPAEKVTRTEGEQLAKLRELDQAGKHKLVLSRSLGMELSGKSYDFQREVLLLQSEALRRTGEARAARGPLLRLLGYIRKLPAFRRKEEVSRVLFLIGLYKQVRYGRYISPRRKPTPTTNPAKQGFSITDDAGWQRAKMDYARYSLGRQDGRLRVLENSTSPTNMFSGMMDMLDAVDMVRPHVPGPANSKAAYLAAALVEAFDKVVGRKKCVRRASQLCNGTLWPRGRLMRLADRGRIAEKIAEEVRQLYLVNYRFGNRLTEYARKHNLLEDLDEPLATLADRRDVLRTAYVEVETFVDTRFRIRRIDQAPSDPLKKIPTGKW